MHGSHAVIVVVIASPLPRANWPGIIWQRGAVGLPPRRRNVRHVWVGEAQSDEESDAPDPLTAESSRAGRPSFLREASGRGCATATDGNVAFVATLRVVPPVVTCPLGGRAGPETASRWPSKPERLKRARSGRIPSAARFRLLCP
jgi:hypothetical protein